MSTVPFGGALEHHTIIDEPPALDHHTESTPDFWIESGDQAALDDHLRQIDQALEEAHGQTGLLDVRADYGFTGIGQTVAVIDSGIAYDHFALGGGFGSNYRVVGGWDFTGENDADPYDDGPSGSHGTHVSGIIGGDSGNDTGVAPGVDLVGLRVFDDAGAGFFSWVEDALNWVHDNRNSFENPITAINLSLGVSGWNSDTIPAWAMLEDEFAQLEADGIFIAVSAGNSYSSFNAAGLSYPAASSHVIPVMSSDDTGLLSYFSQRHSRAIAAPGRSITSTVPDYAGNNNGIADDYGTMSGTSMASPYVAGASVIIREAMEFVGYTNITQDTIYDHMIATADSFFDSATNQSYSRLNVEAAVDALMPVDDFGSDIASAYNLGIVNAPMTMNGAIASINDVDYFAFTAADTGTVTFTVSNMTHELGASWQVSGGTSTWSGDQNEVLTVDVTAGQDYAVGFSSNNGMGYYDVDITAESGFNFTDWGQVDFAQLEDLSVAGETWYRVEATGNGFMTIEGFFDETSGQISLELYNSGLQRINIGNAVNG
ncbi:MAG: S8 family peptidase, partial [Bythopirellula sp.]